MIREKLFEWKNWREVIHTTWNPQDPGVIRIHMIPPRFHLFYPIRGDLKWKSDTSPE